MCEYGALLLPGGGGAFPGVASMTLGGVGLFLAARKRVTAERLLTYWKYIRGAGAREGIFFMSEYDLILIVQKFSVENGLCLTMSKARRIAIAVHKRMENEDHRKFIGWFETSDDYRTVTNSDPTGEQAVRNVLKEMLLSGTPA